jgi:hypothetical protein
VKGNTAAICTRRATTNHNILLSSCFLHQLMNVEKIFAFTFLALVCCLVITKLCALAVDIVCCIIIIFVLLVQISTALRCYCMMYVNQKDDCRQVCKLLFEISNYYD